MVVLRLLALLLAAIACNPVPADAQRARVVKVADGDSLTVRDANGAVRDVRIVGIDAPEGRQRFGRESRAALMRMLEGQEVVLDGRGADRYGRLVARVMRGDRDAALAQLEAGMAWTYPWAEGLPREVRERYREAEGRAKARRAGLWSDPEPTPPWVYRREATGQARAAAPRESDDAAGPAVIGNRSSKLYHLPHCPGYAATSEKNRVPFASAADAERAGYRRASNCP